MLPPLPRFSRLPLALCINGKSVCVFEGSLIAIGSHRHYQHALKPGTTTVPGNLGDQLKPGTLASILRQAGLKGSR
jgi:hypothetical protein